MELSQLLILNSFFKRLLLLLLFLFVSIPFNLLEITMVQFLIVEVLFIKTVDDLLVLLVIQEFDVILRLSCMLTQYLGDRGPLFLARILCLIHLLFIFLFDSQLLFVFFPLIFELIGQWVLDLFAHFNYGFGHDGLLLVPFFQGWVFFFDSVFVLSRFLFLLFL